jgi:hypothetical protein
VVIDAKCLLFECQHGREAKYGFLRLGQKYHNQQSYRDQQSLRFDSKTLFWMPL